ncbi:RagB/SusD family nutrient uptake outer membrane protein [Weeksellaceae bacterium TAE3-ERU29]|nr:RagB/SusD family nutrient uptake outer membrane protein [Weeksellaceae bacterium TAE3-ERU29]
MPDDRAVIDSPEKIGELLTYAYPAQNHQMFCYGMSDNATEKTRSARQNTILEDAYAWGEHRLTSQDSPESYWNGCYEAIKQINHALKAIDAYKTNGEIPDNLKAYYGEALVARAYCHFMLVNLWSKSYNPQTAKTDLGIPYVTEPETKVTVQYHRGTVESVYKNIESDLTEGLKYIDDNIYKNKKLHWNKAAANTFAARFYSIIGKFDKVLEYTNLVLTDTPANQLRDLTGKYSKMDINEAILEWSKTSDNANLLVVPQYSNWFVYTYGRNRQGMSVEFYRFVFRKSFVGGDWIWNLYGSAPDIFFVKWGYHQEKDGINSSTGYYMIMNPLIEIEETLFLRMEANVMLNNYDVAEKDLDSYLSKRLKNYNPDKYKVTFEKIKKEYFDANYDYKLNPFYTISDKQRIYLNCLYDLRRKEFYYTGMRWFDHKRFNTPVRHFHIKEKEPIVLEPGDNRRELQIPTSAQAQGIEANPR